MNNQEPVDNSPLYFIDQYVDGQFMSRSEPFYDKDVCIKFFNRLIASNDSGIFYRISVSLSLVDFENLQLQTHKLHVKFVDRQAEQDTEDNVSLSDNCPKAFRYNRGFVLLNNRKSREFLSLHNLSDFFSQIGTGDHFFISKKEINRNNLNFENLVRVKNLTEKVSNLLP
tara:strand:- start:293 stop:802 length:510 start_codon:yes stop_codon:yes gene_type:complete